ALNSNAEGIRINAAKVLGQWGDKESIESLRALLADSVADAQSDKVSVLVRLLKPHLDKIDRDWVIDLYLERARGSNNKLYLKELLFAFPLKESAKVLAALHRAGRHKDQIPQLLDQMQFHAVVHRRKD
ncbi:MAG TPA: hypothetical protein VFH43_09940, partial [Candidatus Kapabacteria bacterium]|nr:hypothetical protein [Candidatus Kapabacteria bacterium]